MSSCVSQAAVQFAEWTGWFFPTIFGLHRPQMTRQARHGPLLKYLKRIDRKSGFARPGRDLKDMKRVGAESEDVVVDTYTCYAQYLGPDVAQNFLFSAAGCGILFRSRCRLGRDPGERLAIQFSVLRAGQ